MLTAFLHLKYKHITITGIKSRILLKEQYLVRDNQQTHALFTQKLKISISLT